MNITPKDGPKVLNPAQPGQAQNSKTTDRMARALAKLTPSSPVPVADPSSISPIEAATLRQAAAPEASDMEAPVAAPAIQQTAEESPLSAHYAALARREKALRAKAAEQERAYREKEAQIKAQEDAWKAKETDYSTKYVSKEQLMNDPLSLLNENGITYDKLTEMMLNPQSVQVDQKFAQYAAKMEAQIKALEDKLTSASKAQEEAQSNQYKQALNQIHSDVKAEISVNPEFEMIKATGSSSDVVELIERVYNKEGVLLSVDEACREVEAYLMSEAERLMKVSKLNKKFQPAASAPAPVAKSQQSEQKPQQMKTLTNAASSTKKLSAKERAILRFQGKL